MNIILTDHDKKRNRSINAIKRSIRNLESLGYRIEADKNVETMFGTLVDNVYVRDYTGNRVCLQKHLFTINSLGQIKKGE